jgi:dipeptidyl aminopeptidase/acylaminoacyl peptidase
MAVPPYPPTHINANDPSWGWAGNSHLTYTAPRGVHDVRLRVDVQTGRSERIEPQTTPLPPVNPWLKDRALGKQDLFTWENEGRTLEGVLTLPPTGEAPYPLLLYPHGGPHSRSRLGFDFVIQVFAGAGYAVFQPNYRGSAGYGQAFIDADRNDLGFGDMRDMLTGVDALIEKGIVDRDQQYLSGVSYGGYSTCWLVGQTSRFRSAVAVNAVTDLSMMWGLSDIRSWTTWEFGGRPWEVPGAMRRHSPITYAANVTTPTLILHNRDDRRCPLPMGVAYHQALRSAGVKTGLVIYDDEGHGIRQPDHRIDMLERTLAWLKKPAAN